MNYDYYYYEQLQYILSDRSCFPESIPVERDHKIIQESLHSRYQRYETFSQIPIFIILRVIRDQYFEQELDNLKKFYGNVKNLYTDDILY